jgi:elongation factor P
MISFNELKKQQRIIIDQDPYEIIESSLMFKGRGQSVMQTKLRNLITGNVLSRTFRPNEKFEEAELEKKTIRFIYRKKDEYVFCYPDKPSERFSLFDVNALVKPNEEYEGLLFNNKVVTVNLPIKTQMKVKFAPPGVKGDRAQAGNKIVTLENDVEMSVPLFINEGDIVEINTEKAEYVRKIS